MKVAICFWGLCRSTDKTIESIERCIYEPLKAAGIEYTVYLHTYVLYRSYTNIRSKEIGLQLKNTLWKLLHPTVSVIEDQDTIDDTLQLTKYRTKGDPWKYDAVKSTPFSTLDNHIRALWSLYQVTTLWIQSGIQYDKIIYVRPDVLFKTPLQMQWILPPLHGTILIPDFHTIYGSNDRFAIGEQGPMKVYGLRFTEAYEYSRHKSLHSEQFLSDTITKNGYVFLTIPIRFRRIRANGLLHDGDLQI